MTKGVALLSGGLDSAIAAALFRERPQHEIQEAVFFDYGQRAVHREAAAAAALAQRWQVPWRSLSVPWLGELAARSGSALSALGGPLPRGTREQPGDERSARAVWVPARNAVFVAIAAAVAETAGAQWVIAGFNREEAATFPDNSLAFTTAADEFLRYGTRNGVRVSSPTLALDKAGIVQEAKRLGYHASDFWSCYEGGERPCGSCESCLRSRWDR
ncbi:MAG: 7-cyano-7-deazaguanine synthase QueC [Planctomycetes bacterium]|nr:7-cyano-7-deazaguanine synthase QueC [Planctomycetota bacterium]